MRKAALVLLFPLLALVVQAQSENSRKENFNIRRGAAIEGYDPVSYFDSHPREGIAELSFVYKGVPYRFSSKTNMDKFKADPARFEPAYGGWCAFAMGDSGEKVKIDPETYKIQGGKLYLFYNFWGNNTLTDWNKREKELMLRADRHWSGFLK